MPVSTRSTVPISSQRDRISNSTPTENKETPLVSTPIKIENSSESENEGEISFDFSDDSDSDVEDTRANVLKRMQKIKERKAMLIKRLKLHEAASKLRSNLSKSQKSTKKTTPKDRKPTYHSSYRYPLPRRKSLRIQQQNDDSFLPQTNLFPFQNGKIVPSGAASQDEAYPIDKQKIEREEPRPSSSEYSILSFGDENDEEVPLPEVVKKATLTEAYLDEISSSFQSSELRIQENEQMQNSYDDVLERMNENGCLSRKLVAKRIYTIAFHPREDLLLVAAGSIGGEIGLWKIKSATGRFNTGTPGTVCSFPTYDRVVSNLIFPRSKPNKLYFSSYAGAVRSLDLEKCVFDQTLYDDSGSSITAFDFFDPLNNGILAGCSNGNLVVLDSRSPSPISTVNAHEKMIKSISVHPLSNHYFATCGNDRTVKIFDMRLLSGKLLPSGKITNHSQTVDSAYFSPLTGNQLLTTSLDNTLRCLRVFNTPMTTPPVMTSSICHNNTAGRWLSNFRAVWHPCSEDVIAVGSVQNPVGQIDIFNSELKKINVLTDEENLTSACSILAMHPSRHVITGGNSSGKVFIFED